MKTLFDEMVAKKIYVRKTVNDNYVMLKKLYVNGVQTYSAGNKVTYYVNGTKYVEEVNSGDSCLSPKTFTPSKSGWTFLGWREDKTGTSVLTSKVMGDSPITLYAVFKVPDSAVTPSSLSVKFGNINATSGTVIDGTKYSDIQIVATLAAKMQYKAYNATYGISVNGVKYDLGLVPFDPVTTNVNRSFSLANSNSNTISLYISKADCNVAEVSCTFGYCKLTGRTVVG